MSLVHKSTPFRAQSTGAATQYSAVQNIKYTFVQRTSDT